MCTCLSLANTGKTFFPEHKPTKKKNMQKYVQNNKKKNRQKATRYYGEYVTQNLFNFAASKSPHWENGLDCLFCCVFLFNPQLQLHVLHSYASGYLVCGCVCISLRICNTCFRLGRSLFLCSAFLSWCILDDMQAHNKICGAGYSEK